ncbi:MAG TPA: CRTAC1 family protein [Verrucomicrobiae bacterium]|jgi:hypothetical protein|nr:CRTAC1 family protein [Verrucomicrobiae bacterium]
MKRTSEIKTDGYALFLSLAYSVGAVCAADLPASQMIDPLGLQEKTVQALEENKAKQFEAAKSWPVFHDFQFTDHYEASGIRFYQHPVDDASKTYEAVHYDHGNGMAVADVDGDGLLDIYFVNQLGGNELWRNIGHGKFENITAVAGVGLEDKVCVAASFADIDNDGRPDLFVTTVRMGNILFKNMGQGKFKDITADSGIAQSPARHSSGAVFFDFNNDGLLDLFVANVGIYTINEKGHGGFFRGRKDAFQGWRYPGRTEQSVLYQNLGGGKFKDVSKEMGLEHRGWSGDATFCDLNQDGYPELYVLSMSGTDKYYANEQGKKFTDKTSEYFPKTPWGAMGVKFFDFNLDGLMDLYVTDMHSDMTGVQIKAGATNFTANFEKAKSDSWCSIEFSPWDFARASASNIFGNAFYLNQGSGKFTEVSDKIGAETYWPWGISVADINADGYQDVFVAAGMGYPLRYSVNSVLLNQAGQQFVDSEFVLGVEPRKVLEKQAFTLDCSGEDKKNPLCRGKTGTFGVSGTTSSRSSVIFDLDGDGDLDIVTSEWNDHPQVLISNLSDKKALHFLKIKLVGTASNRDGLGATVKVHCASKNYMQYNDGKSGYLSQSSMPLYFGLADAAKIDQIEVVWPSGKKQTLSEGIPMNSLFTITEPR